jgi:hypothetical protein
MPTALAMLLNKGLQAQTGSSGSLDAGKSAAHQNNYWRDISAEENARLAKKAAKAAAEAAEEAVQAERAHATAQAAFQADKLAAEEAGNKAVKAYLEARDEELNAELHEATEEAVHALLQTQLEKNITAQPAYVTAYSKFAQAFHASERAIAGLNHFDLSTQLLQMTTIREAAAAKSALSRVKLSIMNAMLDTMIAEHVATWKKKLSPLTQAFPSRTPDPFMAECVAQMPIKVLSRMIDETKMTSPIT